MQKPCHVENLHLVRIMVLSGQDLVSHYLQSHRHSTTCHKLQRFVIQLIRLIPVIRPYIHNISSHNFVTLDLARIASKKGLIKVYCTYHLSQGSLVNHN